MIALMRAFPSTLTPQRVLLYLGGISLLVEAAVTAMDMTGLHPCHLCLLQRIPYLAVVALALLGRSISAGRWKAYAVAGCVAALMAGMGLGAYHAGVEYHWFPGPASCTDAPPADASLEALRAQIRNAPLVACDQAALHVFGLSLAAWNAVLSAALATIGIAALRRTDFS
ncbi:MAG: disulfide bond formation protein B [Alphaproteobacteria bacterium]|nr:disulfide bond formation protein B [Alphaproteobacteria bacterium]